MKKNKNYKKVWGFVLLTMVFAGIQVAVFAFLSQGIFGIPPADQLVIVQQPSGVAEIVEAASDGEIAQTPERQYAEGFQLPPEYESIEAYVANLPQFEVADVRLGTNVFMAQDRTRLNEVSQNYFNIEDFRVQVGQIDHNEAAVLIALAIYQEYGVALNGRFMVLEYWGIGQDGGSAEWIASVGNENATSFDDFEYEEFFVIIEAADGELKFIDRGPFAG